MIASDLSEDVTLPRRRRADAAMVLPTDGQVRALLEVAEPKLRAFVALAACVSGRRPESRCTTSTSCAAP